MLLKCLAVPATAPAFLDCFDALAGAYLATVTAEPRSDIEARAAHLLPGLLLARVDGKSPVEYLSREADKDRVRCCARALLLEPVSRLDGVRQAWAEELDKNEP